MYSVGNLLKMYESNTVMEPTLAPPLTDEALKPVLAQEQYELAANDAAEAAAARLRHLNEIGLALSAERDINRLLELILTKSRELTTSDAGSLYLVQNVGSEQNGSSEDQNGACAGKAESALYFCKAQNHSVDFKTSTTFAVSSSTLAGYGALTGEVLSIDDVYEISPRAPYQFNNRLDFDFGYRTKSVLIVPMKNHAGDVIGVLQLINRKRHFDAMLLDFDTIDAEVMPYDDESRELAASLASQAAVALENSRLLRTLEDLFESFVKASASAIEDRDPSTSGHSQRVTVLTVALAEAASEETEGPFADVHFSPQQLKELRYAGLLHDFGKIGVRENILTKSHKLEPYHFIGVKDRLLLLRSERQITAAEAKIAILTENCGQDMSTELAAINVQLQAELEELDEFMTILARANDPSVTFLPDEDFAKQQVVLQRLANMTYPNGDEWLPILNEQEVDALSVRKGSLTRNEFEQIQQHARLSYEFLERISWTPEYSAIPDIAHCHHEKLNGGGYPRGVSGSQISLQSRMMTVADIYDALTASDRPYKRAMPLDRALGILRAEAASGALDNDVVELFIKREIYTKTLNWNQNDDEDGK